jgi:hypothetical protein
MKLIYTTLFVFLVCITKVHGTVYRVNNNYGTITNAFTFTSAQLAHDAAASGDTLHLESSPTSYNNFLLNKKLTIIGPGYFIGQGGNNNQGLQHHKHEATLGLYCGPSSAGSVFIGLNLIVNSGYSAGLYITSNDITINRCKTTNIYLFNQCSNFSITQSFINGSIIAATTYNTGNIYISNNYIQNGILLDSNYTGVYVVNNFINGTTNSIDGAYINNIIHNNSGDQVLCSISGNVMNNLFMKQTNTNYVGNNGNIFISEDPGVLNSVLTNAVSNTYDSWMQLKPGSIANGSGYLGTNIGPFGGNNMYKLSGIPHIPAIYELNINVGPGTNSLPCTLSTRTNN